MQSRQHCRYGEPTVAEPRDRFVPMQRENGMDSYPAPLGFQRRAKEHLRGGGQWESTSYLLTSRSLKHTPLCGGTKCH